jgi:BlaI family penicillinase repressor
MGRKFYMPDNLASKITDSELEVMKLLWRAEDALPVTEIREQLQRSKSWEPATIKTLISRLVSKGVVRQEKRNVFYYSPVITEKEYSSWATKDLITRIYDGKARDLIASLVNSDGLSQDDIAELREMFKVEE